MCNKPSIYQINSSMQCTECNLWGLRIDLHALIFALPWPQSILQLSIYALHNLRDVSHSTWMHVAFVLFCKFSVTFAKFQCISPRQSVRFNFSSAQLNVTTCQAPHWLNRTVEILTLYKIRCVHEQELLRSAHLLRVFFCVASWCHCCCCFVVTVYYYYHFIVWQNVRQYQPTKDIFENNNPLELNSSQ